jgi:hypothetical protein
MILPDIGTCTCDLTAESCDANCCCDKDCGTTKQPWFQLCVSQTSDSTIIPYCSRYLTITNAATTIGKVTAYGGGLCVLLTNCILNFI